MHRNLTPHTWMHRNHHSSVKCTDILPSTHENTIIIISQVNAPESPSHMNAQKSYSSGKWPEILILTQECTEIIIPQVNVPKSYPSHMNAPKSSLLRRTHGNPTPQMHKNLTPHTWMHPNRHSSGQCTEILPLTHKCTEIIILQVNAQESYPSHMNAPKSSLHRWKHGNPTPHTWMHRNHHSSSKCTRILLLTHECIKNVTPQVNALKSYPLHMNAPKSSSFK